MNDISQGYFVDDQSEVAMYSELQATKVLTHEMEHSAERNEISFRFNVEGES